MAEKFVVLYEGDCDGVFNSEADAAEYLLSIAEEAVYEDFLEFIMFPRNKWKLWVGAETEEEWASAEQYFDVWKLEDLEDVWTNTGRVPRQTSYSAMLSNFTEDWVIQTVHYFD